MAAIHVFEVLLQCVFFVSFSGFEVCEVTILTCWPLTPSDISTLALLLGTSETFSETTDGDVIFHTG